MSTNIDTIKTKLRAILDELVADGTIASVSSDLTADFLGKPQKYPVAFLQPPVINQSRFSDMKSVDRTYTMAVSVIFNNMDKKASIDELDRKVELVLDEFDKRITLDGTLQTGWLEPSTTAPYGFEGAKDKLAVDIILAFHTIRDMGDYISQ